MIRAQYGRRGLTLVLKGHAASAPKGQDLVCAAEKYIINADPKRFLQIMENLKNNADKYAKTKVEISLELPSCDKGGDFSSKEHSAIIHFRDFGPGIKDEEIPFITGKFYRGKNVGDEPGSGLGLYIVKELVDKMGGKLSLINRNPGLEVIIYI